MHFPRVPDALTTSIANSVILAALCVVVAGCGGAVDQQPPINGNVYLGAVSGAQVAAYSVDADGHIAATPLATTVTDADGHFVLPGTLRWPLLVKSTGGSYTEEATGSTSAAGETSLSAVYVSAPPTMVLSPYSSAIVADALAAGALTASNVAAAAARVSAFLGGVDPQQTVPTFVAPGATLNTVADGNRMALALGAESQSRTDNGASVATSVQNIVAQSAKGDTLAACHSGAGDVTADGTVSAPADDTCDVSAGALRFSTNPLNRSGVTVLGMLGTTRAAGPQTASAEANACGDRVALLEQNRWLFEGRKNSVQASLLPGMTAANWSTYPTTSTWGPHAAIYSTISAPSTCHDQDTFRRELLMAIENYWVDQNLNYCHHHIPGWTPPENTGKINYRESPPAPTDGGPVDPNAPKLTCTAQRSADGSQSVQTDSKQTPPVITSALMWNGADCSNFTSWVYNFAGLATNQLSGAIGVQACSTTSSGTDPLTGVLLDINHGNLSSMEQYLLPGDLLYITQKKIVGTGTFAADFKLAHVITWTGKRFSDLQAGPDRAKYDLSRIGRPDSRLGGDFLALLGPGDSAANLGQPGHDPWMIIDSHYAGPAYRPFLGWYAEHLSHVRRIIGADAVLTDPILADYVIRPLSPAHKGLLTLASKHANATATSGYRLIYQTSGSQPCYQAGKP